MVAVILTHSRFKPQPAQIFSGNVIISDWQTAWQDLFQSYIVQAQAFALTERNSRALADNVLELTGAVCALEMVNADLRRKLRNRLWITLGMYFAGLAGLLDAMMWIIRS